MKTELTDFLNETFPNLYKGRYGHGVGFECGDGWFSLLYDLSYRLEKEIEKQSEEERPTAMQVKEKFGTLRFYMSSETDEMSKLISDAETKSETTCEICGGAGILRQGGWWATLCDEHNKERSESV